MALRCVVLSIMALAGCAEQPVPAADATPLPAPILEWQNQTQEGSYIGYSLFPVAAGSIDGEGDTERDVYVAKGTRFLRLTLLADPSDSAEYYVAPPSCTERNVADCRSDTGFVDPDQRTFENETPEAGRWRFELAGSGAPGAMPVTWTMRVDCLLDLQVAGPTATTCGPDPPEAVG